MNKKNQLIILADGQGTLFAHILNHTLRKNVAYKSTHKTSINAEVLALVTSHPKAPVIKKAHKAKVPVKVLSPQTFSSWEDWDRTLCSYLRQVFLQDPKGQKSTHIHNNWVLLAGFLKKIGPLTLTAFKNRMINIHPSLLPRHGGLGMYGLHVHRAVIKAGDKKTGISIHFVSPEYDQGALLAQMEIPVSSTDTPESLQKKVKAQEKAFYVATLNKLLKNSKHSENFK